MPAWTAPVLSASMACASAWRWAIWFCAVCDLDLRRPVVLERLHDARVGMSIFLTMNVGRLHARRR